MHALRQGGWGCYGGVAQEPYLYTHSTGQGWGLRFETLHSTRLCCYAHFSTFTYILTKAATYTHMLKRKNTAETARQAGRHADRQAGRQTDRLGDTYIHVSEYAESDICMYVYSWD